MSSPSSLDSAGFAKLWKSLYDPSLALSNTLLSQDDSLAQHRQQVMHMLQAMSKIIFGVDEGKKSIAIVYGLGCLELCMKLVASAQVGYLEGETNDTTILQFSHEGEAVWRSGLKVVKCSVIKCKVGRARCRKARVFDFIKTLLEIFLEYDDNRHAASLVEECMTTLAAICLGDDLNALQV